MKSTRRNFIKTTGTAVGAAALMTQMPFGLVSCAAPKPKEFGFQVWTIKDELIADFPGTLKKMAGLGYKQVEMCSPLGYTSSGFGPLNEMSGTEMKKIIDDSGMTCISSHYGMGELRDSLETVSYTHLTLPTSDLV